jgi:hypothetical protein
VIEPTDEMVQAAQAATCRAESDECMRDALAAVLAIVERDHIGRLRAPGPEMIKAADQQVCACPPSLCYSDVRCGRKRPLDDTGYAELACSMTAGHEGPHRWLGDDVFVEWM